jgi:hypothetical protein
MKSKRMITMIEIPKDVGSMPFRVESSPSMPGNPCQRADRQVGEF